MSDISVEPFSRIRTGKGIVEEFTQADANRRAFLHHTKKSLTEHERAEMGELDARRARVTVAHRYGPGGARGNYHFRQKNPASLKSICLMFESSRKDRFKRFAQAEQSTQIARLKMREIWAKARPVTESR